MKWTKLNKINALPHKSGLYAIYSKIDDRLLYIGKSTSLYNRFRYAGESDTGYRKICRDLGTKNIYIKYKLTEDIWMEKYLIRKLSPPYNFIYNKKAKFVKKVPRLRGIYSY